jgi:hypothetical protein
MSKSSHERHEGSNRNRDDHDHRPYWKRAHHDWRFWVAVCLMLVGMIIYVTSQDLSLRPRFHSRQPMSGAAGR